MDNTDIVKWNELRLSAKVLIQAVETLEGTPIEYRTAMTLAAAIRDVKQAIDAVTRIT